jgi:nickel superoxide dismutase
MMKVAILAVLAIGVVFGSLAYSHCQVPCGIYNDDMRFTMIAEHITTIEKSMKQIELLMEGDPPNANQVVRWVNNKEHHADELSEIVTYYFMAQRIKIPPTGDMAANSAYVNKLTLLHKMLVYSMKAKQTTDQENIHQLRHLLEDFKVAYSG